MKIRHVSTSLLYSFVSLCSIALMFAFYSVGHGADGTRADWLWDDTVLLTKIADLPSNTEPWSLGYDCTDTKIEGGTAWCVYNTALGPMYNNVLLNQPQGDFPVNLESTRYLMAPSPAGSNMVLTYYFSSQYPGALLYKSTFKASNLKYTERYGLPPIKEYQYTQDNPQLLKDSSGSPLQVVPKVLAFSANGRYMVAGLQRGGIIRVDLHTMESKVIAVDPTLTGFGEETKSSNLAISDDGRFIALNPPTTVYGGPAVPSLRVYDTETCLDQVQALKVSGPTNDCEYHDVWNGLFRRQVFGDVKSKTNAENPRKIRFVNSNTISFSSVHDRVSPYSFQVSQYNITVDSTNTRQISMLALGDSYISGEGAFSYRVPTDTNANKCHNSWLNYTYTKGQQYYPTVKSVACSGAKIDDLENLSDQYTGQDRVNPKMPWNKRDSFITAQIINRFTPGYTGQLKFSRELKPQVTLLSAGGNDINFAGIVTSCVDNIPNSTCYSSYGDRVGLMAQIQSQYSRLKSLYTKVKTESKGRVYVMAYPEIAKPGGNCGVNVRMNGEEVRFSVDLVTYLNKVIKNAASDAGVYFVDTQKALSGNRLCEAPKGRAGMNGLTVGKDGGIFGVKVIGNESFHPTALGYKMIGDTLLTKTNNFTTPMPNPTNLGAPPITNTDPLLAGRNPVTSNYPRLIWNQVSSSFKIALQGKTYTVNSNSPVLSSLRIGSAYRVVLHSEPLTLTGGVYDPAKPPTFKVPSSIGPGFHTLHLYGTDVNNEAIDIAEVIYVAASPNDYDGDGVNNNDSECVFISDSYLDEDGDGEDDACGSAVDGEFPVSTQPDDSYDYSALLSLTTTDILGDDSVFSEVPILKPPNSNQNGVPTSSPLGNNESNSLHKTSSVSYLPTNVFVETETVLGEYFAGSSIENNQINGIQYNNKERNDKRITSVATGPKKHNSLYLYSVFLPLLLVAIFVLVKKHKRSK